MKRAFLALALFLLPALASAQTPTVTVGTSFGAAADHDGQNTSGYRVYIDNTQVGPDLPLASLQAGTVTIPGLSVSTRGTHTLVISAFNADQEAKSAPLSFSAVLPAPSAPTNLRITLAVSVGVDGQVQVTVLSASKDGGQQ